MAALLSLFKPTVPPIVKKRAKDLLSVITEAVKRRFRLLYKTLAQPSRLKKVGQKRCRIVRRKMVIP